MEDQNEANAKLAYQKQKDAKDNADKLKAASQKSTNDFISGLGLDHIGDDTADVLFDKQVQGVQSKLMDMQSKGADIQAIRMEAQRTLPQMVNAHTALKDKYDQITKGLVDLGKDFPTGDLSAARNTAVKSLLQDSLNFDDKGGVSGYKDPTVVPQRDYVTPLRSNPEGWYQQSGSVAKGVQTAPMTAYSDVIESRNKKGETVKNKYSGQLNYLNQVDQDPNTKEPIGISVKSEPITIGQNPDGTPNTIHILPKNEFDVLTDTPQKKMDFQLMYNQHLKDLKIDPSTLDPRAADISQRKFAKDWLEETRLHGGLLNKERMDNQPLPPRISVKVNTGAKDVPVIDNYTPIKELAVEHLDTSKYPNQMRSAKDGSVLLGAVPANAFNQQQVEEIMAKAQNADKNIKGIDDVYVRMVGQEPVIFRVSDDVALNTLTPLGTNVDANKKLGQKSVQKSVNEAQGKGNVKTFNVVDPQTGKVLMSGVDENSANKAKAKGYKIQ